MNKKKKKKKPTSSDMTLTSDSGEVLISSAQNQVEVIRME